MTALEQSACCAHTRVLLKPIEHPNGTKSDHWECSDCGTEFWPNVPGKRPRPGMCTCPANGVSSACPSHGEKRDAIPSKQRLLHIAEQLSRATNIGIVYTMDVRGLQRELTKIAQGLSDETTAPRACSDCGNTEDFDNFGCCVECFNKRWDCANSHVRGSDPNCRVCFPQKSGAEHGS